MFKVLSIKSLAACWLIQAARIPPPQTWDAAATAAAFARTFSHTGATSIPMFMALSTKSLAACWLVQAATLTLAGCAAGMLPAVCCSLYPAGVRITGVCLGFHLGEAANRLQKLS
jgi:hypothetical protein